MGGSSSRRTQDLTHPFSGLTVPALPAPEPSEVVGDEEGGEVYGGPAPAGGGEMQGTGMWCEVLSPSMPAAAEVLELSAVFLDQGA